jgi:hypothetical protein
MLGRVVVVGTSPVEGVVVFELLVVTGCFVIDTISVVVERIVDGVLAVEGSVVVDGVLGVAGAVVDELLIVVGCDVVGGMSVVVGAVVDGPVVVK